MRWLGPMLYFRFPRLWAIWARYYCPSPIGEAYTATACFRAGHCGCDNAGRFRVDAR